MSNVIEDDQLGDEIEITPAMIDAGVQSLRGSELDGPTETELSAMVVRAFTAMIRILRESPSKENRL